jgi:hypothetical protein
MLGRMVWFNYLVGVRKQLRQIVHGMLFNVRLHHARHGDPHALRTPPTREGKVYLSGLVPGLCKMTFPDLDQDAWEKI